VSPTPEIRPALVAFALFVTAIVFACATISNDNLQDLKTGQLVGATPWRQQVALILGVGFGALVIPPILTLLNGAFGFQGAPGAGDHALARRADLLLAAAQVGLATGALAMVADGFHSMLDGLSNVVGLIGNAIAVRRMPAEIVPHVLRSRIDMCNRMRP